MTTGATGTLRLALVATLLITPAVAQAQLSAPKHLAPRAPPGKRTGGAIDVKIDPRLIVIGRELNEIGRNIEAGRADGSLNRREARALGAEAVVLRRIAGRHERGRISPSEQRELHTRFFALRDAIAVKRVATR